MVRAFLFTLLLLHIEFSLYKNSFVNRYLFAMIRPILFTGVYNAFYSASA